MIKVLEVVRFELAYRFGRGSTLFYFLIVFALCMTFLQAMSGGSRDDGSFNAPFTLVVLTVFGSMVSLVMMAGFAGDAAARDTETRVDALFYTAPIGKPAYLLGRFLGAFLMSALLLLALPIGGLLATKMPWVDPAGVLPFRLSAHLAPYLLYALPNAFIATAVLFAAASLTRRATASYAAGALLFFTAIVCGKLLAPRFGLEVATLLDPFGYAGVNALMVSLTALQKDTFALHVNDALLANRVLWFGISMAMLAAAYTRFRFAHHAAGEHGTRNTEHGTTGAANVPPARRQFQTATRLRQLRAITMRSFRELHGSRAWWIVPLLALLFILEAPGLARTELGIPQSLSTARLLDFLSSDVSVLVTLLIALSVGELVWRERGARMEALSGVTPVPDALVVAGKFLGLAMMLTAALTIFFGAGLAVQTIYGADRYDLAVYLRVLYTLLLPEYLIAAALATLVHVLVNQKYVANVIVVLVPVVQDLLRRLGVEDGLLLYGSLPPWMYSDISGFSPTTEGRLWFTLYFGGWALLLMLAAYLFWVRGEERDLRQRTAVARRRFTRAVAMAAAAAMIVVVSAGGFIFYRTHVREPYRTNRAIEERRAEYERRYGRYASLPQPVIAATKLQVEFYPRQRTATILGSYRLENRGRTPIDAIHVATSSGSERTAVSFDRAARLAVDDGLDYRIYTLGRALQPGESLQMHFRVEIASQLFRTQGRPPVVGNGSFITHRPREGDHWIPIVGYEAARELNDPVLRKKYKLRARPRYPRLRDAAAEQKGYETTTLETIIGTDAPQIGVAPGTLRRRWSVHGRSYVHYVTDVPISNAWTITCADYAVRRARWRPAIGSQQPVDIEIFHHPTHTANLERMIHGVEASLEYDTRVFGPYPYRQVRLVEYPSDPAIAGMTAHSGLLTYAEGFAVLRPAAVDFPFAVVSHEMGHQWWGHRLTPAFVEGAPFLTESLAWYSGMLVVEETFGRDHLQRLLDLMRADYLRPNQPRTVPLLRAVDQTDAYRRGPFAMYALREAVGVEPVNRALRNLLAKFPPGRAPYPTSLDFYAELRAVTPASSHALLRDLFEEITFWELSARRIAVQKSGPRAYRVTLQVEAQKLKGDSSGTERAVAMNDLVEILIYDAQRRPLHRATHRLRSGVQTIELTVARPPAGAIVDPDHELLDRRPEDNEVKVEE
ncbi:MAG TPA: ABC transporter permease [Thermoanaerobaculia bacterium]|jgi:ABC-type transport system involved in multi-copper enzyme maturation permease subunit